MSYNRYPLGAQGPAGATGPAGPAGPGPAIGGTVTGGTQGSVLFVGPAGVLAQDNAKFFWDEPNKALNVNTGIIQQINTSARTYLTAQANPGDTTLTVNDTSNFSSTGLVLAIGTEIVSYTGMTATTFTGVARGLYGTSDGTHFAFSEVNAIAYFTGNYFVAGTGQISVAYGYAFAPRTAIDVNGQIGWGNLAGYLDADSNYASIIANTSHGLKLGTNNVNGRVVIDTSGNVSIPGTSGLGGAATTNSYVTFGASTTGISSFNLPVGSAPSAPVDGDVWREDNTNTGLKIRINGVTKTITVS